MTEKHLPKWRLGVVASCETRDRGFIFLKDEEGNEYFAHRRGFLTQALFDVILRGDAVRFRVTQVSKGMRAHAVERAEGAEAARVAEWAETLGNK